MVTPREEALLEEILVQVHLAVAEVSALKVENAKVIANDARRERDVIDHEARIRLLEADARSHVTHDDLAQAEARREEAVAAALEVADRKIHERTAEANRKANQRLVVIGLIMSAVIAAVNIAIAALRP